MRLRAGVFLFVIAILTGVGCRKPLSPADNNKAPETWLTAAPQDTLVTKDAQGRVIPSVPGKIPVRFHLYWAGADEDGEVVGYYFAVTETLPDPPPGLRDIPNLPGPKPADYHFTTRSDTTLIFNVSEGHPDRQHGFYVYAVDNKGRADPTPARVIFNAQDKYPPALYIDEARAVGDMFIRAPGGGVTLERRTFFITDTVNAATLVKDTIPSTSQLTFRWHAEPTLPGTYVTKFKYKLDEPNFIEVDSSVHVVTYNSGPTDAVAPGAKRFTVRAIDQAGGSRQANRRFQMNMSPTTWFAGPDPNAFPYTRDLATGATYLELAIGAPVPSITGSQLSRDSVTVLPASRPEKRTFFEIYKNRIYVRSENDTVSLNSWVVFSGGGVDPDSPYNVKVSDKDPNLPDTSGLAPGAAVVIRPGPPNGSPIGFRSQVAVELNPSLQRSYPSLSGILPVFDPASTFRAPRMNAYWPMIQAGRAYAIMRAEDGDGRGVGGLDLQVLDPPIFANQIDAIPPSQRTDYENDLRSRILTFYVDRLPFFRTAQPGFTPAFPPFTPSRPQTAYPTRDITLNLPAGDDDPYDFEAAGTSVSKPPPGRPSATTVIRISVKFRGQDASGADTVYAPAFLNPMATTQASNITIPSYIVSTTVIADIELCDCRLCELQAGEGRCTRFLVPFTVPPPAPALPVGQKPLDRPGPGSSTDASRSTQP